MHVEQGLGDTIQLVRYASLVQESGGRVVLGCQEALCRLLSRCQGIDRLVAEGSELPPFDVHLPLLSLPRVFGTTLATVPATVPYVFADPGLVEHWRRKLSGLSGLKVGIVWQGNPAYNSDRRRSISLIEFASLARLPNVHLISLQRGVGVDQLTSLPEDFRVLSFGDQLDQAAGPFMDTAAIIMSLDLVIAPDTAIAHLEGPWAHACGSLSREARTGVGCWVGTTVPGIRRPGSSASAIMETGATWCSAWRRRSASSRLPRRAREGESSAHGRRSRAGGGNR